MYIGVHLGVLFSYNNVDTEVTKKIRNMRTQYSRERQKFKKRPTGTGTDDVYKPKWPHFDQLKFLDDFITPKKTISNLEVRILLCNHNYTSV